jgi:predicted transposase/invertase (TIGR01784 family)
MTKIKSQAKLAENVIGKLLPKYDLVFKKIFGDPRHTNILISFLNSIIECNYPITSIQLENVELVPEYTSEKWSRLDILATTQDGEIINIEIQIRDENNITKRALFYWSRIFGGQLISGANYNSLKRTIIINVLDSNHFQDDRYWHKGFIIDPKSHELIDDSLEIHFLELKKMLGARGKNTTLEMWLKFINNPYSEEVAEYAKEIPAIAEAQQLLARVNSDPVAKAEWRLREKSIYYEASAMAGAREKGREEGRREERANLIKNLLASGVSIEQVAMATNLTSDEVEKLALVDV